MKCLFFLILSLTIISCSSPNFNSIEIKNVKGSAYFERFKRTIGLDNNDKLKQGDIITTGENGLVEIKIGRANYIAIQANSRVILKKIITDGIDEKTIIEVKKGRMFVNIVRKLYPRDTFQVDTPSIVAAVRGTQFVVTIIEDTTKVVVLDGAVVVRKRVYSLDDTEEYNLKLTPEKRSQIIESIRDADGSVRYVGINQELNSSENLTIIFNAELRQMVEKGGDFCKFINLSSFIDLPISIAPNTIDILQAIKLETTPQGRQSDPIYFNNLRR